MSQQKEKVMLDEPIDVTMTTTRSIKYLKNADQFQKTSTNNKTIDGFLTMGNNDGKSFFKKIPTSSKDFTDINKPKFQHLWMSKQPVTVNEIVCSEPFRILLGDNFAPKYRIYMQHGEANLTVTRLLESFTPWVTLSDKAAPVNSDDAKKFGYLVKNDVHTEYDQYALSYLKTAASLPNFNQMVAVCLLFGKDDLHGGNWGVVEVNGKKYAATVDHGRGLEEGFR